MFKLMSDFSWTFFLSFSKLKFCTFSICSVILSKFSLSSSFKSWILESLSFSRTNCVLKISSLLTTSSIFFLYSSILCIKRPISIVFNSSLNFKYSFAFSDCILVGSILTSISEIMSLILNKFNFDCSIFFSDSCFLTLYFTIPAASSKTCLLSSDLLLNISSILPCPTIE